MLILVFLWIRECFGQNSWVTFSSKLTLHFSVVCSFPSISCIEVAMTSGGWGGETKGGTLMLSSQPEFTSMPWAGDCSEESPTEAQLHCAACHRVWDRRSSRTQISRHCFWDLNCSWPVKTSQLDSLQHHTVSGADGTAPLTGARVFDISLSLPSRPTCSFPCTLVLLPAQHLPVHLPQGVPAFWLSKQKSTKGCLVAFSSPCEEMRFCEMGLASQGLQRSPLHHHEAEHIYQKTLWTSSRWFFFFFSWIVKVQNTVFQTFRDVPSVLFCDD